MKHTELPWVYQDHRQLETNYADWHNGLSVRDKRNICVAVVGHVDYATVNEAKANAALIVKAVNSHDRLLEACRGTLDIINSYSHIPAMHTACEKLQAAIDAAETE